MGDLLLEMRAISKSFPGVHALGEVNFSVRKGEILCLLGENGAGKSTLMKILTGVYQPDSGAILFEGKEVRFKNTSEAFALGISVVFQEFNLCPNLSAMENLFLGNEVRNRCGLLSYRQMRDKAKTAFGHLRIGIEPEALVKQLGIAQQQMIEVAKALSHQTKILIMDEPTSALAGQEIRSLFDIMRDLKSRGISIVFISHKLNEVLEITDRVICLRDGRNSGEVETRSVNEDALVGMMVGRELDRMYTRRKGKPSAEVVLEVRDLAGPPKFHGVSFKLRKGEITGLAGLIGAGRTELARLIMGAERRTSGAILINGQEVDVRHPAQAVAHGVAYASEDRKRFGLVLPMTVRENTTMSAQRKILNRLGFISPRKENAIADHYIGTLRIKVASREQVTRDLSGGNQQKVVLAKWLAIRPAVLILDEPTRGIDVGAKAEIHKIIADLADEGVAILMISSELPEILHVCERILVMHEGTLTADLPREHATEATIMKAAVG